MERFLRNPETEEAALEIRDSVKRLPTIEGTVVSEDNRAGQLARAEALFAKVLEQDGTRLPVPLLDRRRQALDRSGQEGSGTFVRLA